jgi:hypothetical protein
MFVETILENGGVVIEWVSPPIAPTHKTKGISLIEWRTLFQPNEPFLIDELEDNINNSSYSLVVGGVSLDDTATLLDLTVTYRQFLRTCFKSFSQAQKSGIDVDNPLVMPSLYCFEIFGLLAVGRKEVIIQGVPL